MNPTNDVRRRAEVGVAALALALASGQAASAFALQNLARAGDNVVSSTDLYGGTWNLFANTLKDQGIEVRFADPADPENFRKATDSRTRGNYAETLTNPKLIAFPIAEVAAIGRSFGVPLVMDNTAAPILTRWRGDHRLFLDQILGGHGASIGGLLAAAISPGRSTRTASRRSTRPTPAITARYGPKRSSLWGRSPISSRRA
jgi:O-acetylhomoserine (thiol)-lyase